MTQPTTVGPLTDRPGLPMAGVARAKQYVADFLQANLASVNADMRPLLDLPASTPLLPDPGHYYAYEPPARDAGNLATSETPGSTALVYVGATGASKMDLINFDIGADPIWDVTYTLTAIVWVKSQDWATTIAARDNLTTTVRATLLAAPGLVDGHTVKVELNTIREAYAWPEVAKGNRHVAGGTVSFSLTVRETLNHKPIATVRSLTVKEVLLPDEPAAVHPALL